MRYMTFDGSESDQYDIAILVPRLDRDQIQRYYIDPLGVSNSSVIAFTLEQSGKKTPVATQKEYLSELFPVLQELRIKHLLVGDSDYFKTITKESKAEPFLGYVMPSKIVVPEALNYFPDVVYVPNFAGVFYDPPKVTAKISQGINALRDLIQKSYVDPGEGIIHFAAYPNTVQSIKEWLQRLLDMDCDLTCDIEGFSLKHYDSGIGTIAFAWNKHEGIAFAVDYQALAGKNEDDEYGSFVVNQEIKGLLVEFFSLFRHKIIFHNISYDATVLVYQLFMKNILDTEGLLTGLDVLLKNWDDTKLITYLATNSCAGNRLGLKEQAQEFAGNYAVEEIKDIRRIPLDKLLQYNLVDCLSTWYVHEKHYDTMVNDQQLDLYNELFKPAILDIIQMQLTGLPVDMDEVKRARVNLQADMDDAVTRIMSLYYVQEYIKYRNECWVVEKNNTYKKKRVTLADANETFNLNSDPQLREFIYDLLKLPEIDYTDSKLPSTGADTLKKLKNHTQDQNILDFLDALIDYKAVVIILNNFIPAFESAVRGPDGWHYLFGNFNLGGTVSMRLSSNNPNLQNIPATGSRYAKAIKKCVKAPPGWLFCGLDFDSLEDKISALTTKDPNKLKVYTDGYDGHCLRAFFYFREQLPTIEDTVESINSIKKLHEALRQESKAPTFALTYQGTYITLMNNCGFSEEKAKMIEARYHEMYQVSDQWVEDRLQLASQTGYVTAAFGLRVRTPLLKQVIRGSKRVPFEAQAEGRTAGNALGQSWCSLNTRAGSEFMGKVRKSEFRLCIRPCAQIHDAQYVLIRDDLRVFQYTNKHLVEAARWQNHPDIWHDEVKLGGSTSVFYPNWAYEMPVKNEATDEQVIETTKKHLEKLKKDGVL